MIKTKIAKEPIVLFLLFFSELFSFKIGGFNTKYIVELFWFVLGLIKYRKIKYHSGSMVFDIGILLLLLYSVLITILMQSGDSFATLRYCRALLTSITIYIWIINSDQTLNQLFDIIELILSLHGICILMEIIYPPFKDIIQPISQYNKEFMRLRASGFLSGYDDAGLLLIVGVVINYFRSKAMRRSVFTARMFIYAAAVLFASRISMLILFLVLFYIIISENRNGTWKSKILIAFTIIVGGGVVVVFWILTTDVDIELREKLFHGFPVLKQVYNSLMSSYTDYGTHRWQTFTRHWYPEEINVIQYIIGKGVWPETSDIGYIKNIYATGIISIIGILVIYIFSLKRVINSLRDVTYDDYIIKNYAKMYCFIVILMMAMEMKVSILFSSTSFELLIILYFTILIKTDEIGNFLMFE